MGDEIGDGVGSWAKAFELARANTNAISEASLNIARD
jgi:hypothetical protein